MSLRVPDGAVVNLLPLAARKAGGALTPVNVFLRVDDVMQRWPAHIITTADGTRFDAAGVVREALGAAGWTIEGAGEPKALDLATTDTDLMTIPMRDALIDAFRKGIGWSVHA